MGHTNNDVLPSDKGKDGTAVKNKSVNKNDVLYYVQFGLILDQERLFSLESSHFYEECKRENYIGIATGFYFDLYLIAELYKLNNPNRDEVMD